MGGILKESRQKLNYSQQYVVDKLPKKYKVLKQTLSKYEKGKIRMGTETFNEICKILDLNPKDVSNSIKFWRDDENEFIKIY